MGSYRNPDNPPIRKENVELFMVKSSQNELISSKIEDEVEKSLFFKDDVHSTMTELLQYNLLEFELNLLGMERTCLR